MGVAAVVAVAALWPTVDRGHGRGRGRGRRRIVADCGPWPWAWPRSWPSPHCGRLWIMAMGVAAIVAVAALWPTVDRGHGRGRDRGRRRIVADCGSWPWAW